MGRKDSLYLVLDTSEESSAFTVKTKWSHPFFSMVFTLKVLLLERLMRKKNYFDLRVQKMKDSRVSLPQQLAQLSHIALPGPEQVRIHFASDWFQVSQRPALHPQWSATTALSCSVWEMSLLTELNWPSQLGKAYPNVFTVSCQPTTTSQLWVRYQIPSAGEQAAMRTAKGAHVNETPGKGECQSSKECSAALQHTNMWVLEVLNSLFAQNQVCNDNQGTTATWYFLDLTYPTECLETQKYHMPDSAESHNS